MKKSFLAIIISILLASGLDAQIYNRQQLWDKEINAFAEIDRRQTPPANAILFVGGSSIRGWTNLRSNFPRLKVINRGFGGARMEDVNFYFDKIVAPYNPRIIVLYAGEDDLNEGIAPETVLEQYRIFASMVKEKLPKSEILYVSLKPNPSRRQINDKIIQTNSLIRAEVEKSTHARFVDVYTPMLDENGEPNLENFNEDRQHLNEKGYAVWRRILHRYFQ